MPFIVAGKTLARVWEDVQNVAIFLRAAAQDQRVSSAAGNVSSSSILSFEARLRGFRQQLDDAAAVPNIATYVNSLPDKPVGYDVNTEFNNLRGQLVATVAWIQNNFPRDTTNTYMLAKSWGADGPVDRLFTVSDLAAYRVQLDALLAACGTN